MQTSDGQLIPLPVSGVVPVSVCVWWVERGVWVRVGSLAGYLGVCCHRLQAVLVEVSPCFDSQDQVCSSL